LPVPIALGAAVLLGILSLVKTKRPIYYTVEEGDNLCTIGECFGQDYRMVYDRNKQVTSLWLFVAHWFVECMCHTTL
jgi:hypothetical protein